MDAGVVNKTRYVWNRILDGCHYTNPFVESTETGKKGKEKQMRKNKKGNEEKQEAEKWRRAGETERGK
jgi:hypothetical protein